MVQAKVAFVLGWLFYWIACIGMRPALCRSVSAYCATVWTWCVNVCKQVVWLGVCTVWIGCNIVVGLVFVFAIIIRGVASHSASFWHLIWRVYKGRRGTGHDIFQQLLDVKVRIRCKKSARPKILCSVQVMDKYITPCPVQQAS
jgi:hypothetical protein